MIHELKTEKKYYDRVVTGEKKFELRKNDRDFQVGDEIILIEMVEDGTLAIDGIRLAIKYILHGPLFGLEAGYCILNW